MHKHSRFLTATVAAVAAVGSVARAPGSASSLTPGFRRAGCSVCMLGFLVESAGSGRSSAESARSCRARAAAGKGGSGPGNRRAAFG